MLTVLMTCYKEKKGILISAIESILNQTYTDFEFIIILDNPDNLEHIKIINEYQKKDNRIRFFINEKNIGLTASLNKGIMMAKGNIIARMDADDIAVEDRLMKEFNFLQNDKSIRLVSTNKMIIDNNGIVVSNSGNMPTNTKKIIKSLLVINFILHPGVMYYRDDIIKLGLYREIKAAEDYDLWLRYITADLKIGIINDRLMKYRVSDNNTTLSNSYLMWCSHRYCIKLFKERIKEKNDSYNYSNFESYIKKKKIYSKKSKNFGNGVKFFTIARQKINNKNFLGFVLYFFRALLSSFSVWGYIFNSFKYKFLSK